MAEPIKITRKTRAAEAARKWREQYPPGSPPGWGGADREATYAALVALGPLPDPDAVDALIGNTSWTDVPECDGCERTGMPFVVRVGDEPDYESSTAWLCSECLAEAVSAGEDE